MKRLALLLLAAAALPACFRSSSAPRRETTPATSPAPPAARFSASRLSGGQVVPAVTTTASGSARVDVDAGRTRLEVLLQTSGLSDITEAHLHAGDVGVDGPIVFTLASAAFVTPLQATLTEADLIPAPAQGIASFSDAVDALAIGRLYVDVHTTAHPDGEIRGQIGPVQLASSLSGNPGGSGTLTLRLNPDQTQLSFILSTSGVSNVVSSQILAGTPGGSGASIFTLATGAFYGPLVGTLTTSNFTPRRSEGIGTFDQAVDALLSGNAAATVSTAANPDGEITGSIQASPGP